MTDSRQQFAFRFPLKSPLHARAFSLHDALIAMAVASTLTVIGVSSFQLMVLNQRMSGTINALVTALHLARSEAIKRRESAVLCPSPNGHRCVNGGRDWEAGYLLYIDRNDNRAVDADETVVRVFGTSDGLRLRTNLGRDDVRYLPNGLASGTNTTFTVCDTRGRSTPKAVVVSNAGRVRTATRMPGGGAIVCPSA